MGASPRVLQWVSRGVRIQFTRRPPAPFNLGKSLDKLTPKQQLWWEEERRRLIAAGAWEPATCTSYVSKAFLVPKPGENKWRLVLDLRHLNKFCQGYGLRMETLRRLQRQMRGGEWMASFDLKDGFYAIGIAPEHRKYFTFCVNGEMLQYAALPMGWNGSPFVFTRFTQVLTHFLRSPKFAVQRQAELQQSQRLVKGESTAVQEWGVQLLHYLDDYLLTSPTKEQLVKDMEFT